MTTDAPLQLLGGISAREFLRDYWQKRPLLVRNAFPGLHSPLQPEDLAGLARSMNHLATELDRKLTELEDLSQVQQQFGAQPVFLVGASVFLQKALDLLGRRLAQAQLQLPVGGPGLQRMALGLGKELFEPFAVALAKSLLHVQQHLVPLGLGQNRGRGRSQQRTGHQRCQNLR